MKVSTLYGESSPVRGRDVHVVGLGPSMSVFPVDFLAGKTCLLLNDAQRYFPTLGPIAFANHKAFLEPLSPTITHAVVKGRLKSDPDPRREDNHVAWDDPARYVFSYRSRALGDATDHMDDAALFAEPDFYWRGPVAVFACQFLLLAGARSIALVGCDCGALAGEDYFDPAVEAARRMLSKSRTRRAGEQPITHNYEDYASGLVRLRREARERFGVPILSLSPFFGHDAAEAQYRAMRAQDGRPVPKERMSTEQERAARRLAVAKSRAIRRAARLHQKRRGRVIV